MPSTEDGQRKLKVKTLQNTWFFRPSHNPLRRDGYDAGWALVDRPLSALLVDSAKRGGAKLWRRDQSGRSKCTVLQSDRQTKFSYLALGKVSQESYVSAK